MPRTNYAFLTASAEVTAVPKRTEIRECSAGIAPKSPNGIPKDPGGYPDNPNVLKQRPKLNNRGDTRKPADERSEMWKDR